jgi:predicted phosphodiesterase
MKWTPEEEQLLISNLGEKSYSEIETAFHEKYNNAVPGFPVMRSVHAIRRKVSRDKLVRGATDPYQESWKNIIKSAKEFRLKSSLNDLGLNQSKHTKILSFSDLHIPFFLWENMEEALQEHSDADIVVLNGDILDAYIFSTFSKSKNIAALKEYRAAFDLVHYLSDNFPNVILVCGNHDYRTTRAIKSAGFAEDATKVYRPDLLSRIANGEKLDEYGQLVEKLDFSNVHYQIQDSWYVRVGKTIFCHPSGFGSKYPGATVVKLLDHFSHMMDQNDFDSIVVGHTHKVYKGVVSGKLLIEQGAMAHRLPYQFKADLRFKNAMNGYAVIYQDENGNTNFNNSQPIYLGSHLPVKKGIING